MVSLLSVFLVMSQYPTHQSILIFDVEGFGDPHRDNSAQLAVRAGVYRVVQEAVHAAGVPWPACTHEDRGDGTIVLVPPEVSKVLLLDPLLGCLSAALAEHNRTAALAQRFRLRMALHAGEVSRDAHGLSGADLVLACRMLDAAELKTALRRSPGNLAVIVSDGIYDGIVRHRYRTIDPAGYHPVSVQVKKDRIHAWIHLPGTTTPPVIVSALAASADPPHQLLPSVSTFVDREGELHALARFDVDPAGGAGKRLVVLVGPPGVGKTALALHWAHRIRDRYGDGQLYADLGGPGGAITLEHVLGRFLGALGVAAQQVPVGATEQAALFRKLTADLRLLVLLDNAASAADVRALLPASPASVTVVTGRSRLGGLTADGARFIELAPLTQRHGVELLARSVGETRISAEAAQAQRLVNLCGGLPIALSVTGARLATRPRWTVEKAVSDLLDEHRRLARLSFGDDLSVQAVFDVSYQALSEPAARLYRLLGLHPGPDFDAGVAAALLRTPLLEAEGIIDELLNANLLDELHAGRCRFHELLRLHARQRAEAEDSVDDRTLAVRRMLDWYLHTATVAGQVITPHRTRLRRDVEQVPVEPVSFPGHPEALEWLDRERVNLLAAARHAHEHGLPAMAWQLADAMWGLFLFRTHYHDWLQFDLLANQAARACADPGMEAESQDRLALLYHALGRNDEALEHMGRAAELWRQLDEPARVASSLERFGFAYLDQGRVELAIEHFTRALAGYREIGAPRSEGLALISLGRALMAADRVVEATEHLRQASEVLGSLTPLDPYNSARALIALGRAETRAGHHDAALDRLRSALVAMRSVNSPLGQADAWWALAELHEVAGRVEQARDCYRRTVAQFTELGNPAAARVQVQLTALDPEPGSS